MNAADNDDDDDDDDGDNEDEDEDEDDERNSSSGEGFLLNHTPISKSCGRLILKNDMDCYTWI
ncbi:hypothetical protein V1478_001046 [Vespula squamosa]|uniref:Uncharacterized protein n=1 Tax=Vespula squamosa TaxID=30214 RepID=A0ABD2C7U1_VESSQ